MKRHIYGPLSAKKMLNCLILQDLFEDSILFCFESIKNLTDIIKEVFWKLYEKKGHFQQLT